MFDFLKTFVLTIKSNRLILLITLFVSIIGASINEVLYKPKYIAEFEVAPHFEFAYDLGKQLEKFVHDLNIMNSQELLFNRELNIEHEKIFNASFDVSNSKTSYNFKHIKLRVTIESHDKNCDEFKKIDEFLVRFCNDFINDTTRRYKGIERLKTKLKLFSEGDTSMIRKYHIKKNYYKHKTLKDNLEISDALVSKIIYAEVKGDLENAKKNNFNNLLQNNVKIETRIFKAWEFFLLISMLPSIVLTSILREKKYD